MSMPVSQENPWYLYLISKIEDIVVSLRLNVIIPKCFPVQEMRKLF